MFEYISVIQRNGVEYQIRDEAITTCELLVDGIITESFADALANAQGKVNFKLLNNVVISEPVFVFAGADVVLDLNGHTITPVQDMSYSGGMITVNHGGSLTINGEGTVGGYAPDLMAPLQLTNKNYADDTMPANLTINGGNYIGNNYCICGNGNPGRGNTHVVINGGTFNVIKHTGAVIYNPQENSSIVINGGKLIGASTGVEMRSGNLTVNGGYIEALNAPASVAPNGSGTAASGSAIAICQHTTKNPINLEINGGVMRGYHALYQANPQNNEEEAVALVQMTVINGSFVAMNSTMPVYSENKTGFIYGGSFSHPVDAAYEA